MNLNSLKTQQKEIPFIHQASLALIKVLDMIKVQTPWQYKIINMYSKQKDSLRNEIKCEINQLK